MAKKKVTTTVEETEEAPQELDYNKDIKDKSFEQVLETPKEEVKEPKEEPKETPKEEETETVEFDPEQLKKEAVAQAKEELGDLLKGKTDEETKENVDEFQEYQKEFFAKNNRQPTWFEVAQFTKEQVKKDFEAEQEAKAKTQEEETTKQKEIETKNQEDTNKYVADTLKELYEGDKLPKIQNKDDKDDYGIKVQNALLKTVVDVNTQRIKNNLTPKTIKEIFYEDFKVPSKDVPGADAPVNMGRGGYTPDDNEEIDYKRDIQGRSIRGILSSAFRKS